MREQIHDWPGDDIFLHEGRIPVTPDLPLNLVEAIAKQLEERACRRETQENQ